MGFPGQPQPASELDGRMKEVTETVLEYILAAHPGSKVEMRGENRVVLIPMYDIETDRAWIEERKIIANPEATPVGVLPVFNVRSGAKFNPAGDVRTGAFGQLYRIIGWSPPSKEPKE